VELGNHLQPLTLLPAKLAPPEPVFYRNHSSVRDGSGKEFADLQARAQSIIELKYMVLYYTVGWMPGSLLLDILYHFLPTRKQLWNYNAFVLHVFCGKSHMEHVEGGESMLKGKRRLEEFSQLRFPRKWSQGQGRRYSQMS